MITDEVQTKIKLLDQRNLSSQFQTSHSSKATIFLQGKMSETSKI